MRSDSDTPKLWSAASQPASVFIAAFGVLLLVNFEHLPSPPYWDAVMGYMHQATWLARHDLDVVALHAEPPYLQGGPRVSLFYVLAPTVALLLRYLPPRSVFTILHLLTLLSAAAIVSTFYSYFRRFLPPWKALIWCLPGMVEPIWLGQSAAIYLDMPLAACVALSLTSALTGRPWRAVAWAALGTLVKPATLVLALALVCWIAIRSGTWISCRNPREAKRLFRDEWPMLLTMPFAFIVGTLSSDLEITPVFSLPRFVAYCTDFFPWVLVDLSAAIAIAAMIGRRSRQDCAARAGDVARPATLLALVVFGFWTSFSLYPVPLPRYATPYVFPLVALLAVITHRLWREHGWVFALLLCVAPATNVNGGFLPRLPPEVARSGSLLERSREYLRGLAAHQRLCSFIEAEAGGRPIVVRPPLGLMLAFPEMGYVTQPIPNVHSLDWPSTVHPLATRQVLEDTATLYIYEATVFDAGPRPGSRSMHPPPGARVLFLDSDLHPPLVVYQVPTAYPGAVANP